MKKVLILLALSFVIFNLFAADAMMPVKQPAETDIGGMRIAPKTTREAPEVNFTIPPVDIISSYYDYMPGGYNSWCLRSQPEISEPGGLPANGMYVAFHTQETSNSTRRVYYAYIDNDGNITTVDPISPTDVSEGYAGIDVDPITGDPMVSWHAITEADNSYDSHMAYDLYHLMGTAGLWTTPWIVIDNPEVSQPLTGASDDEFIWPKVMIGPSPEADKRRVYVYGDNSTSNSAGVANYNIIMGYADFSTADLDMQYTLDWTYKTFPLMDYYQYEDVDRTIKDMAIADDGKVAFVGWAGDSLKVWYSENYGEDFEYYAQSCHYDVFNPQDEDGTYLIENDDGSPADIFFYPSPDGGHFNAVFVDGNSKIQFFAAMGLTSEETYANDQYYPYWFYPKIYNWDVETKEFGFWDLYIEGTDPADDQPMVPWDQDEDGVVDSYSEEGLVEYQYCWPSFFYEGELQDGSFHCSTFKLTSKENWLVAVWQDGTNAMNAYDEIPGYEGWAQTPEICIATSSNYGQTWSQPAFLNAKSDDENYYSELADMIPCYVYPGDKLKPLTETTARVDLFFMDDNSYGSYALSQYGLNNGSTLKYAAIEVSFEDPLIVDNTPQDIPSAKLNLKQNYPNPFNPETTIEFALENTTNVKLEVYNLKGQKIATLVDENLASGQHSIVWQGKDDHNNSVGCGVYFYKLTTANGTATRKMLLLK
jgi:hypothetical protein